MVRALTQDLERARKTAEWKLCESTSRAILEIDPFHETATLCLAEALARSGSKHKAVSLLTQFQEDTGRLTESLTLPSRLLKRRISEPSQAESEAVTTQLVGRCDELRTLSDTWSRAQRGSHSLAVISGEQGIGKSRLLSEFLSLVQLDGSGATLFASVLPRTVSGRFPSSLTSPSGSWRCRVPRAVRRARPASPPAC